MRPQRLRRIPQYSYTGPRRYSLTFSTCERRRLFVEATLVDLCQQQILRAAEDCGVAVFAYCFMPDHLHLVVHVTSGAPVSQFVKRAKQLSGYRGKQLVGSMIWQTGFFERTLREWEDTRDVVTYILENPVRAGIVRRWQDYPFSVSNVPSLTSPAGKPADKEPDTDAPSRPEGGTPSL